MWLDSIYCGGGAGEEGEDKEEEMMLMDWDNFQNGTQNYQRIIIK